MKNFITPKVNAKIFLVLVLLSFSLSNFLSGTILAADTQGENQIGVAASCPIKPGDPFDPKDQKMKDSRSYFQKAYDRQGGQTNMGCATTPVHWWEGKGLLVQNFDKGNYGKAAIFYDVNLHKPEAYALWGPILDRYWNNSQWGPPQSNMWPAGTSPQGTTGYGVNFGADPMGSDPNRMQVYSSKYGAYVVRGDTLGKYNGLNPSGTMSILGFPTSDGTELRGSTEKPSVWHQPFEGGAIYTYATRTSQGNLEWTIQLFPIFKWPWKSTDNPMTWSSGPHSLSHSFMFLKKISASRGSGLDFAKGGASFDVVAMASGKVIMNKCGSSLGCIVAVRHNVEIDKRDGQGSVMIYAHLESEAVPGSTTKKPKNEFPLITDEKDSKTWVNQSQPIGRAGNTGGVPDMPVHLHIEFRDGANFCDPTPEPGFNNDCGDIGGWAGNPIGWDGKALVDGYFISGYFDSGCAPDQNPTKGDCIFNYDGSAIKGIVGSKRFDSFPYYDVDESKKPPIKISRSVLAYVDKDFVCNSKNDCEIQELKNTIFSGKGVFGGGGGFLYSTNGSSGNSTPPSTCPSDGRSGVYFYTDKNYKGACFFSKADISGFVNTPIGDNKLSSVDVKCKCQVKLYENKNFGGRYDILNKSDSNLDIRSLGGRYSSAKITIKDKTPTSTPSVTPSATATATRTSTPTPSNTPSATATATNTYTLTPSNTPTSTPTATDTFTPVPTDTSTPSPTLEPTPTETPVPSETPTATLLPTDTPTATSTATFTATPTQTPFNTGWLELLQNGGFEACNMNGWNVDPGAGAFDVTTNNPRSGRCAIQRSHDANPAWFYQNVGVNQYRSWIDAGYGVADFEGWFQIGDGEQMRVIVRFYQGSVVRNEFLVDWTSVGRGQGWVRKGFPTSTVIPTGTDRIYVEIGHKRDSGTNNDVDTDDVSLKVRFASP